MSDADDTGLRRLDDPLERLAERRARRWWELGKSSNTLVRQSYRLVVLVVGSSLVLLGLALVVLPGPWTIPLVLLGFAVLATEFVWARHLLDKAKGYAAKAKDKAKEKGGGLFKRKKRAAQN